MPSVTPYILDGRAKGTVHYTHKRTESLGAIKYKKISKIE
jgi:hypothetical protein